MTKTGVCKIYAATGFQSAFARDLYLTSFDSLGTYLYQLESCNKVCSKKKTVSNYYLST